MVGMVSLARDMHGQRLIATILLENQGELPAKSAITFMSGERPRNQRPVQDGARFSFLLSALICGFKISGINECWRRAYWHSARYDPVKERFLFLVLMIFPPNFPFEGMQ